MSDSTVDPTWCAVHGPGARVERVVPSSNPNGTGGPHSLRWWTCPQCNEVLRQQTSTKEPVFSNALWEPKVSVVKVPEGLESLVAAAQAAKVIIYDDPRTLNYDTLEEGVRGPCRRINESGWVFTAESCHGHVHEDTRWGGSWGDDPFLRLTTRQQHFGHMLALFTRAMTFQEPDHTGFEFERTLSFNVARDTRGWPEFGQAIIRIQAGRVYVRRLALEAFARFAELVNQELP